jgi:hypothetical protein
MVPGEQLGQLAVKTVLDHGPQLARSDGCEVLERPAKVGAPKAVGDSAHVHRHLLLDPALKARLGPAALSVPAVNLVVDRNELDQRARPAPEQPSRAAAHNRDSPSAGRDHLRSGSSHGTVSTTGIGSSWLGRPTDSLNASRRCGNASDRDRGRR